MLVPYRATNAHRTTSRLIEPFDSISPVVRTEVGAVRGLSVVSLECHKTAGAWSVPAYIQGPEYGLSLVRRGGFIRRANGRSGFVDATMAYFEGPGTEVSIGHDSDGGDDSTLFVFSEEGIVQFTGDAIVPEEFVHTTPDVDLAHRALIVRLRRGVDSFELEERLALLLGALTEIAVPGRLYGARTQTEAAHQRIVDRARGAIAADPAAVELAAIAADLGHSRYHVSRIFSRMTGTTLSRHRNRIRISVALDRLADGEENLAGLAADLGFVDQSHMVRVMRTTLGQHPSGIRAWLRHASTPVSAA